jgi:hypothetical protein
VTRYQHLLYSFTAICILIAVISPATPAEPTWPIDLDNVPAEEAICFALYTVQDGVLKMTAQLYPLADGIDRAVKLQIRDDGAWRDIAEAKVSEQPYGWPQEDIKRWTAHFRVRIGSSPPAATPNTRARFAAIRWTSTRSWSRPSRAIPIATGG